MSHEEAVAKATEEFVDFNPPTHKIINYLNIIGIFWFTTYGMRILKVIKNSIVDKPFEVLMSVILSSELGMDNIMNSVPGVTKGVFSNVGNPISMGLDSLNAPITVNIMDDLTIN